MKSKLFILALFIFGIGNFSFAQCGSHHKSKKVKSSYHHKSDIVDIASSDDNFATLVTAVKIADLVTTLKGDGPFTVFAPTNNAFAKLPQGTVASLLEPQNKSQLTKILTYHVVAGEFKAKDVINAVKASGGSFAVQTVSGDELKISLSGDTVLLTDENGGVSAVTKTDVNAANGVIHVIDSVVLPK